ncbi:DUF1294 domain-containing protein [Hyphomonas sp. WL0036]|uniref:DUF1294 domain-containing protein n=1 Tax=Hyphomonas sediminis TaxID=2866160 RepID=UPI001C7F04CF|nr:DUF1294 domain-containing protein [Hyphomonas sediminis]
MSKPAEPPSGNSQPVRLEGRLVRWNGDRGFGFLIPVDGGPDAFAHIHSFPKDDRHIEEGHLYSYTATTDQKGRVRASDIRPMRPAPPKVPLWKKFVGRSPRLLVIPAFLFIATAVALNAQISQLWFAVYGIASVVTFIGYGLDKRAAKQNEWRISETILLMLGLVGGWPGAIVAQELFRHKTKKLYFRTLFWMSVAINIAGFVQIAAFTGA